MGTLVKQLLAFDKDILGATPPPPPPPPPVLRAAPYSSTTTTTTAALSATAATLSATAATVTPSLRVHKKQDSLLWRVGEPVFNRVRGVFEESAQMAREDLQRVE